MRKQALTAVSILLMQTASAQWQPQHAGFSNDTLGFYEMSLPNDHTAWTICYDGKGGLISNRLVLDFTRTVNGGTTWVPGKMGTDTTLAFSNITAVSEDEAWVAMHKRYGLTGGGLYHTEDGGLTWSQSGVGEIFDANSFPNFVHFKDKNHGVAMGDPNGGYFEIYTTNNGGKKWKRVAQDRMSAALPNEYGWISGFYAVGNSVWFGTYSGRIWKSDNFGKDWTAYTIDPAGSVVNEIAFNDDGLHGVAHLRNNQGTWLWATDDGGLTWINRGNPANWKRSRITAVPGTNALVSTSVVGIDPGSAVSYNNGATWTTINNTIPMAVCRFYDANTGYAGSFFQTTPFNPGIFKSTIVFQQPAARDGGSLGTAGAVETSVSNDAVLVYPSPASDQITIALSAETVSDIQLLNMEGKVVETRRSKGAQRVQMDVSKYAPGLYTLRVRNGSTTTMSKVTIAR